MKCTLENDGNLRLLDPWGREKWSSGTGGKGNASSQLLIQDDGNVVINTDGKAVWSTNMAQAPEAPATATPGVPSEQRVSYVSFKKANKIDKIKQKIK